MTQTGMEPDTSNPARLPVPAPEAGNAVPADLMAYTETLWPQLLLRASNTADRDARYSSLPGNTVVMSTSSAEGWVKNPAGGWWTFWRYADEVVVSMPWRSNVTGSAKAYVRGGSATVHVQCEYSGPTLTGTSDLGIANPVPPEWRQPGAGTDAGTFYAGNGDTGDYVLTPGGSLYLKRPNFGSGTSIDISWPVML